ncbi:hypothetical protein Plhal304r1_c014g0054311 [Plasmopara halstedii]
MASRSSATQQSNWTSAIFEQSENDRDYHFMNLRCINEGTKIFKQYELFSIRLDGRMNVIANCNFPMSDDPTQMNGIGLLFPF